MIHTTSEIRTVVLANTNPSPMPMPTIALQIMQETSDDNPEHFWVKINESMLDERKFQWIFNRDMLFRAGFGREVPHCDI